MGDSDLDYDVAISSISLIPEDLSEEFVANARKCGARIQSETREQEVWAGIEWLVPTAIVVFIAQKYLGTLLQEAAKEHYPILKNALATLILRTSGKRREVRILNLATTNKVSKPEADVLSVMAILKTGHSIKFIFEQDLEESEIDEMVSGAFQVLFQHQKDFPVDPLTLHIVSSGARLHWPVVMFFDRVNRQWSVWPHSVESK